MPASDPPQGASPTLPAPAASPGRAPITNRLWTIATWTGRVVLVAVTIWGGLMIADGVRAVLPQPAPQKGTPQENQRAAIPDLDPFVPWREPGHWTLPQSALKLGQVKLNEAELDTYLRDLKSRLATPGFAPKLERHLIEAFKSMEGVRNADGVWRQDAPGFVTFAVIREIGGKERLLAAGVALPAEDRSWLVCELEANAASPTDLMELPAGSQVFARRCDPASQTVSEVVMMPGNLEEWFNVWKQAGWHCDVSSKSDKGALILCSRKGQRRVVWRSGASGRSALSVISHVQMPAP